MPFTKTNITGVYIFEPLIFEDERGYFYESYNEKVFRQNNIDIKFIQDNQSYSVYGVIRGLHYQLEPYAQSKLVRVLSGRVLDIVVDIRKGSPSYGKWEGFEISADNKKQIFIPKGFAHGFSVLSATAEVVYKCDNFYNKDSEGGIKYNDPLLRINWEIPADKTLISPKDLLLPAFADCKTNFEFNG